MSEECTESCQSCQVDCDDREEEVIDFSEKLNDLSSVKKVIGVVSGKGGVGKSLVTSMLAVLMNRKGYKTAVLDADITGPSIPKVFGIEGKAVGTPRGLLPATSKNGIDIMSVNLILENPADPVVWRGPVIAGAVKQFWTDVIWKDIDYMFIDMPPGTGDVPLTVFQSIPVDGIVIVTSPQALVSMIVSKSANMAKMMNVPILGIVENMSYVECPDCDKQIKVFGESDIEGLAKEHDIEVFAQMPMDPKIANACDRGDIESFDGNWLDKIVEKLEGENKGGKETMKIAVASDKGLVTEHFGHCETFMIFEGKDGEIVKSEALENPGHKPGFLPNYLNEKGVNVIISGGMGAAAVKIFNEHDIEVIVGAKGEAEKAAKDYIDGKLESTGSVCHHEH